MFFVFPINVAYCRERELYYQRKEDNDQLNNRYFIVLTAVATKKRDYFAVVLNYSVSAARFW